MKKILLSIFILVFAVSANSQTVLITGFAPFGGEKITHLGKQLNKFLIILMGLKSSKNNFQFHLRALLIGWTA